MDDVPDYILRANMPVKRDNRFPPRVRQPGPPEGEDFFTLTERHGRPIGVFETIGRHIEYRGAK
jgi:hypothetical protein